MPIPEYTRRAIKNYMMRQVEARAHLCEACDIAFQTRRDLDRHMLSRAHEVPADARMYECKACNYKSPIANNYLIHCKSIRHKSRTDVGDIRTQSCEQMPDTDPIAALPTS